MTGRPGGFGFQLPRVLLVRSRLERHRFRGCARRTFMEVDDCDHQSRTDAAGPARTGSTRPGGAPEPSGSEPDGLRHGHGWIPINGSLITKVTQITIVTSANCRRQRDVRPWKGVTCRRVLESHRYRWRRRPLSDSALQSVSRHQRSQSPAQVLPPLPNPLRLRRPLRPCPRRPAAYRQGTDLPTRMNARRYPGWVSCRWPSSTRYLHALRGCNSKRG